MDIIKANERLIQIASNIAILNQPGPLAPSDRVQIDQLKDEFNSLLMEQRGIPNDPRFTHVPSKDRLKSLAKKDAQPARLQEAIWPASPTSLVIEQNSAKSKPAIPGLNPKNMANTIRSPSPNGDDYPIHKKASQTPRRKIQLESQDWQSATNTVAHSSTNKGFFVTEVRNPFEILSDVPSEDEDESETDKENSEKAKYFLRDNARRQNQKTKKQSKRINKQTRQKSQEMENHQTEMENSIQSAQPQNIVNENRDSETHQTETITVNQSNIAQSTDSEVVHSNPIDNIAIDESEEGFIHPRVTGKTVPIIVEDPKYNWKSLNKLLKDNGFGNIQAKFSGGDIFNIKTDNIDTYRAITSLFDKTGVVYHSFTLPVDKHIKVIIKHLPADTDVKDIFNELVDEQFQVEEVVQLSKRVDGDKVNLPLFLVTLTRSQSSAEIYHMRYILKLKVKIETYKGRPGPAQCHRCQNFFHAQRGCRRNPRCVKCAGDHWSSDCTKPRTDTPKCCDCGGEHTANYSLCPKRPTENPGQQHSRARHSDQPRSDPQPRTNTANFPNSAQQPNAELRQTYENRVFTNRTYAQTTSTDIRDSTPAQNIATVTPSEPISKAEAVLQQLTTLVDWLVNSGLLEVLESLKNGSPIRVNNSNPATQNITNNPNNNNDE